MQLSGSRPTGMALVALSAVLWSTAGLFVRMADLDAWTVLGWRSLFSAIFLGGLFSIQSGPRAIRDATSLGWSELFMVATSIMATICYVFALKLTTVANVMTIYATLPFVAAGIAFVWLGERASTRILIASAIALVGIAIMAGSATEPKDIAGNLAAFAMTVGFGTQLVHAKRHPDINMTLVIAIAAGLCAVISWPLMAVAVPSLQQLTILAAFGILTTGVAYTLALDGSRRIGSGEAGFISMLDVILGPLWVWLFFAEQPGRTVLVGGAVVLTSVLWFLSGGMRPRAAS
ncbi:DMT family transporter [Lichenifustis flavocetrariae]|uniref:DMT family transporter n=1 Tax=Lichenifustis flavocetrariae TaxID=2949735 RepID=A0AA41YW06_9HYPH|nr:DMT family transporter [Lichenifustis flavocetrariae]MCW6509144.1 DMT family transporter [Lichenifustis flavocetrariae]